MSQVGIFLLEAVLEGSDFDQRGFEPRVGALARDRLRNDFTDELGARHQVDRPMAGFAERSKSKQGREPSPNTDRNAHMRAETNTPAILGFGHSFGREIVG